MIKIFYSILFLFSGTLSAQAKPNDWICDIKISNPLPDRTEVVFSLKEPIVTKVKYIPHDDGTFEIKKENLITELKISSWKVDKSKCQTEGTYQSDEFVDSFDFNFACGAVKGTFNLDFNFSQGLYHEEFTPQNISRTLVLTNCREKTGL